MVKKKRQREKQACQTLYNGKKTVQHEPQKNWGDIMCTGKVSISCCTIDTRYYTCGKYIL